MNTEQLTSIVDGFADKLVELRRDFHRHPETAWQEFRTTAIIAKLMEEAGFAVKMGTDVVNPEQTFAYPSKETIEKAMERALAEGADPAYVARTNGYAGVCAELNTGRPGPVIAYRFDIDCNDVTESGDADHRPAACGFASTHPGEMHACGHDGHAATGIGLAWALMAMKEDLCGVIRIIFQPAEEGVRGARSVATSGLMDDVDYFLTGHIAFGAKQNDQVYTGVTGFLATSKFDAIITGAAAHAGASPQDGCNAVLAAASSILNMHALCQDGRGASRVNVGVVSAGSGRNVVADSAVLKIETRGETSVINERMEACARSAVEHSCAMYGCSATFQSTGGAKGIVCSPELSQLVSDVSQEVLDTVSLLDGYPLGGSEDVTYMMEAVENRGGQATFTMFGAEIKAPHHAKTFDFDEGVLARGVKIHAGCALRLCQKGE